VLFCEGDSRAAFFLNVKTGPDFERHAGGVMKPLVRSLGRGFLLSGAVAFAGVVNLRWEELPALPPSAGQAKQPGVAGPFAGIHGDALIVAGGANFPVKLPWEGGTKAWWDDVWVLENTSGAKPQWIGEKRFKLPRPIGYGISVSTSDGVICAGGHDAERCYPDVFMLSWDARARELRRTLLPSMPQPLSFMAGALVGTTLYVAGGQTGMKDPVPSSIFWALDLSKRDRPAEFKWEVLPPWPGPPRVLAVAAAQRSARGKEFFLFSGRRPHAGKTTEILSDAYAFDPKMRVWRTLRSISDGDSTKRPLSVMAGTAAAVGDSEVLLFGGDRGERYLELEAHDLEISAVRAKLGSVNADLRPSLEHQIEQRLEAKRKIYDTHPGFAAEVLAYDTKRDAWRSVDRSPFAPQVTTIAVVHQNSIIIPSGEIKPGIRTPAIVRVTPVIK
jgi:solute:Na+ symporter, SSS family